MGNVNLGQPAMIRRQIHLSREHVRKVNAAREREHVDSAAEIIRRAIDAYIPDADDLVAAEGSPNALHEAEAVRVGSGVAVAFVGADPRETTTESALSSALSADDEAQVQEYIQAVTDQVESLTREIDATIARSREAVERMSDPEWIEQIRTRTRQEAETDPGLVPAVAKLTGINS